MLVQVMFFVIIIVMFFVLEFNYICFVFCVTGKNGLNILMNNYIYKHGDFFSHQTILFCNKIKITCMNLIIFAFEITLHLGNTVLNVKICSMCPPSCERMY
jgi:hypothetical protein